MLRNLDDLGRLKEIRNVALGRFLICHPILSKLIVKICGETEETTWFWEA